jgi:hypothetical protein
MGGMLASDISTYLRSRPCTAGAKPQLTDIQAGTPEAAGVEPCQISQGSEKEVSRMRLLFVAKSPPLPKEKGLAAD